MQYNILLTLLLISFWGASQPDPLELYPDDIKRITEQLKTDPTNYSLIWERTRMRVCLMGGFPPLEEIFHFEADSVKMRNRQLYYDELNADFNTVYQHVIQTKNTSVVEAGDFYMYRVLFDFHMLEFDKGIEDALYLRDFASQSVYWQRDEYYHSTALVSLFNLYVLTQDYMKALEIVDTALEENKRKNPSLFFSSHGGYFYYETKVQLLQLFARNEEVISFLKETCSSHFAWYFEKAKYRNETRESWYFSENEYYTSQDEYLYRMNNTKEKSFSVLKELVDYLERSNSPELEKYEKIYNRLRYQVTPNFESIDPAISDEELETIVSPI